VAAHARRSPATPRVDVYLEIGAKRTFAGALDWPGWCRSGRDERSALEALAAYAPRYERALRRSRLGFRARPEPSLTVVERLAGSSTTDFGAPGAAPSADAAVADDAELRRLASVVRACWRTFDETVAAAEGHALRTGPRGGGRDLARIVEHVCGAEEGYLAQLGWRAPGPGDGDRLDVARAGAIDGLRAWARGEIEPVGPRGGHRWTGRYFVRRAAWHALDHAWEIEDRMAEPGAAPGSLARPNP
jgi:hypothetical protein